MIVMFIILKTAKLVTVLETPVNKKQRHISCFSNPKLIAFANKNEHFYFFYN